MVNSSEDNLNIKIEEELIFPSESVVKFPSTIGITGEIFKSCAVTFVNGFSNDNNDRTGVFSHKRRSSDMTVADIRQTITSVFNKRRYSTFFNSDVDNFIGVKNIRNFLIASMNEEDEEGRTHAVGVIQFFNKRRPITEED